MTSAKPPNVSGIDPHSWQNLSLNDLTEINRKTNARLQKMRDHTVPESEQDPLLEFFALNMHWVDPLCPGIPDGRFVN